MDDEQIENQLYEANRVQQLGFASLESFNEFKLHSVTGLIQFGDIFSAALGLALKVASFDDSIKILRYWHNLCEQYAIIYKMYLAKK